MNLRHRPGHRFVAGPSPLDYRTSLRARRVTLVDGAIPLPDPKEVYFAQGAVGFINGRKATVPAALPGAAAFLDYSVDLASGGVFIHYVAVRRDLRGEGYGTRLVEHFLRSVEKDGVPSVDFGRIEHDAMEKLFLRWRRRADEGQYQPRVYGKL